jgi:hypothetical protein
MTAIKQIPHKVKIVQKQLDDLARVKESSVNDLKIDFLLFYS